MVSLSYTLQNLSLIFLFLIPLIGNAQVNDDRERNYINIHYGLMYYPDWKFNSKCLGFSYSHDLKEKCFLEFGLFHTEQDLFLSGKLVPSKDDYGMAIDRTLNGFDAKFGFVCWNNPSLPFNLSTSVGFSFIWGSESILSYVREGPPFNEVGFAPFFRHHPGLNLGMNFKYFPVSFLEISTTVTGRLYVKGQPDLTLAINAGFNFGR